MTIKSKQVNDDKVTIIHVRIPTEILTRFKRAAKNDQRSLASLFRHLMVKYLDGEK